MYNAQTFSIIKNVFATTNMLKSQKLASTALTVHQAEMQP